jgi:Fe-S oxidoreductase
VLSGECIKACNYGVNPRFLLGMARVAIVRRQNAPAEQRRQGVEGFRKVAREVTHISQIQLDDELLARLGQKPGGTPDPQAPPDFVFYTGCNVLKTPHIALTALDIMDRLGVTYQVLGGPTHCCGVVQMRTGDIATSGRFAESTMDKLARSKSGQVISWCPSCHTQFTETTLPTIEKMRRARPFEMTPFMLFLRKHLDRLQPLLQSRVDMRVALHRHPGISGVVEAAEDILRAVPGVELVDLKQPAVGMMSNYFRALPAYRRELQMNELDAAERAQVDALVAVYHADHRELCAHERDYPFRIMNVLEIVGASMGIHHDDRFKRLKMLQDADAIAADCADLIARHGLDPAATRAAIQAMLDEQPLPLRGNG